MRPLPLVIPALLTLAGCREPVYADDKPGGNAPADSDTGSDTGTDTDTDTDTDVGPVDSDGDGVHDGADCEPEDATVYPGAEDIPYDGIDQDCDGLDLTDADGDGYDAEQVGGSDCDDENPSVNPGALDEENDFDDDCDGEVDEDVPIIPTDWPIRLGGTYATTTLDRIGNAEDGTLWVMGTLDAPIDAEPTFERVEMIENDANTRDVFLASYDEDRILDKVFVMSADATGTMEAGAVDIDPGSSVTVAGSFSGTVDVEPSAREYTRESQGDTDGVIVRINNLGDIIWGSSFGGAGADRTVGVVNRPLGGLFVAGEVSGDASYYGPGSAITGQGTTAVLTTAASGDTDGVLIRYNPDGRPQWVSSLLASTAGEAVHPTSLVTSSNAVIVAGTFSGTMDADPDAETTQSYTAAGTADAFAVALDPDTGELLWAAVLPCTGAATVGHVGIDTSGNLVLGGSFTGTIDLDPGAIDTADAAIGGSDGFVVVLDTTGARTWSTVLGGAGADSVRAAKADGNGGVAITGAVSGTAGIGGETLVAAGARDCFAARLESGGAASWAFAFGSSDDESCSDLSVSPDDYVYFSGPMTTAFDFSESGTDDLRRPAGPADVWVHRLPLTP